MDKSDSKLTPFWKNTPLVEEKDIFSELAGRKGSTLFLGQYSLTEAQAVLGKKSFFRESRKRNLWPLEYDLDSSQDPLQRLRIYFQEKRPERVIVDLKIRKGRYWPKDKTVLGYSFSEYKCLILEWLTLQNPLLSFSPQRPRLPGQLYPGLGLGKKVVDIFAYLARLSRLDAILAFPAYFHNAVLFSRFFRFVNPAKEAEILAIRKAFSDIPFKQLAWVVHLNCLKMENGEVYEWKSEEQVIALHRSLRDYFDSKPYREAMKQALRAHSFSVDWANFHRRMKIAEESNP